MRYLLPTLICLSLLLCSCELQQRASKIQVPDAQQYTVCLIDGCVASITAHTQSRESGRIVNIDKEDRYKKGWLGTRKVSSITEIIQDANGTVLEFKNEKHRGIRNDRAGFDIYSVNRNKKIQEIPISKETLFELQVPDWLKKRNPKLGDSLKVAVFDMSLLEETQHYIGVGWMKTVSILGKTDELRHLEIEAYSPSSVRRMSCARYVNEQWKPIKERSRGAGPVVESYRCTREAIPETITPVVNRNLVLMQSPVRIRNMADANRISYRIKPKNGSELNLPATDYQKIVRQPDGNIIVEVSPMKPPQGHSFPYAGNDPEVLNALKETSLLECSHETILELTAKAIGTEKDTARALGKIRSFVCRYLRVASTDADSVVEIAAAGKGKCFESAKLMAAMCRSVGIPCNVVCGYIYSGRVPEIKYAFSGHAWVQAYVGDKWHALDPTCLNRWGSPNNHTVGHIATYVWEGQKDKLMEIAGSLGTFEIVSVQQY
ncbi:MAG: transglutaminase-like domain-containing protein [Planctomycetota bacterium]